jgi:hypothetical protein
MSSRVLVHLGGAMLAGALGTSCTTVVTGTHVAEPTASPSGSPSVTASPPATTSGTAAPTTAPESDADQIRDVITAWQDAYNTQNWDAYLQDTCEAMRKKFTGVVIDMLQKGRAENGITQIISVTARIDGDQATAIVTAQSQALGRQTITNFPFVRQDGWKICMLDDYVPPMK